MGALQRRYYYMLRPKIILDSIKFLSEFNSFERLGLAEFKFRLSEKGSETSIRKS